MASVDFSQSGKSEREIVLPDTDIVFDLLRQCSAGARGKNFVFAPLSITTGLAMACMGACGNTAEEIRQVLKWSTDVPPTSFGSYLSSLKEKTIQKITGSTLIKAQRMYVDGSFTLKPKFSSDMQEHFASQPVAADFKNNPEGERKNINSWMLEQTQGKVRDLLSEGAIDSSTSMLLVQGADFNGVWKYAFHPRNTHQADFFTPTGTVQVHMMHQTREFGYGQVLGTPAVELPYTSRYISDKDGDLGMIILLPKNEEELEKLEKELNPRMVVELLARLSPVKVDLKLPRFSYEQPLGLKPPLMSLGLRQAFGEDADFSGMIEEGQMNISNIFHSANVYTDEEGTVVQEEVQHVTANSSGGTMVGKAVVEADPKETETAEEQLSTAAASIVKETPTSDATPFYVDHQFLFFIIEKKASEHVGVLVHYWGRVVDPLQKPQTAEGGTKPAGTDPVLFCLR